MSYSGRVYLLHFDRPLHHARHYLGSTHNLAQRLEAHRNGTGARLMAVLKEKGIGWQLAKTWRGARPLERRLKLKKNSTKLCPICKKL